MASKNLTINLKVVANNEAVTRKAASELKAVETQAASTTAKVEATHQKIAVGLEALAAKGLAMQSKIAAGEEAAAAKSKATAEAKAASLSALEDAYLKRDYDRRVAYEARKQQQSEATASKAKKAITDEEIAAKVSDAKITASNKARTMAAMQAANVQFTHTAKLLSDEEIQHKVKNQAILNANQKRIEAAMKAADVEYKGAKNGWEGVDRLLGSVVSLATGFVSLQGAVTIMGSLGESIREAAESQERMTNSYITYRDAQREQLNMQGKGVTTAEVLATAKFEADTGMTASEAKGYTSAFYGSGAQHKGKLGKEGMEAYRLGAAKLAMTTGIDPSVIGDLAGAVAGERDYVADGKAKGKNPGDLALAALNQKVAILQAGSGDNASLTANIRKFTAYSQSKDEGTASFSGPNAGRDAASFMSVAAEASPQEPEVFSRNAIEAIRNKKVMTATGITDQDDPIAAYKKLSKHVMAEAKAKNLPVDRVLTDMGIKNQRARMAASTMITKGVVGGLFESRQAVGDANATPEQANRMIDSEYANTQGAMAQRVALARTRLAEHERGQRDAPKTTLAEQAREKMVRDKTETRSFTESAWDKTVGHFTESMMGGMGSLEYRRTAEMEGIMQRRAKAQGVRLPARTSTGQEIGNVQTEEGRNQYFRAREQEFKAQGGNMLVDLTKQQLEESKKLREILTGQDKTSPLPVGIGSAQLFNSGMLRW